MKKLSPENLTIHLDEHLLAINKPPGLPVLPDGYDPDVPHVKSLFEPVYGPLWIVHRLDRDTSGLLLLARTPDVHRHLNGQFEGRQVSKVYHALVAGRPEWDEQRVALPLRPDGDRQHRTVVDQRAGKASTTVLRVLERLSGLILLEARPETGRTHQIRAHLAAISFPIAVDPLYGDGQPLMLSRFKPDYRAKGEERPLLGRLGLHAWSLDFTHPAARQPVHLEASYSKDFGAVLTQLRKLGQ
jgi:RluA family pseudouridine synthase